MHFTKVGDQYFSKRSDDAEPKPIGEELAVVIVNSAGKGPADQPNLWFYVFGGADAVEKEHTECIEEFTRLGIPSSIVTRSVLIKGQFTLESMNLLAGGKGSPEAFLKLNDMTIDGVCPYSGKPVITEAGRQVRPSLK